MDIDTLAYGHFQQVRYIYTFWIIVALLQVPETEAEVQEHIDALFRGLGGSLQ